MATQRVTAAMNEVIGMILDMRAPGWERIETVSACMRAGLIEFDNDSGRTNVTPSGRQSFADYTAKRAQQKAKRNRYARARNRAMTEVAASLGLTRTRHGWE